MNKWCNGQVSGFLCAQLSSGALVVAVILFSPAAEWGPVGWWMVSEALSVRRVLPLIGLGAALALLPWRAGLIAFGAFASGIVLGGQSADALIAAVVQIPGGAQYHFFTRVVSPVAFLSAGVALASPARVGHASWAWQGTEEGCKCRAKETRSHAAITGAQRRGRDLSTSRDYPAINTGRAAGFCRELFFYYMPVVFPILCANQATFWRLTPGIASTCQGRKTRLHDGNTMPRRGQRSTTE